MKIEGLKVEFCCEEMMEVILSEACPDTYISMGRQQVWFGTVKVKYCPYCGEKIEFLPEG